MKDQFPQIQLIECPRDALQSYPKIIPTAEKVSYYQMLLKAGFHTLDMGSFVSPRAVPQLADTDKVIDQIDRSYSNTQILVIVANEKGASQAVQYDKVDLIGYPLSVSETFQLKNSRQTIQESLHSLHRIKELCSRNKKSLVVYLSMAFGNPYGDDYHAEMVVEKAIQILKIGADVISIADTIGLSSPTQISLITSAILKEITTIPVGLHLHGESTNWKTKIEAGYQAGCRRFDGALGGYGGCPFTGSERVGNMDTLNLHSWFSTNEIQTGINSDQLALCSRKAHQIFS